MQTNYYLTTLLCWALHAWAWGQAMPGVEGGARPTLRLGDDGRQRQWAVATPEVNIHTR